jgi:two-component system, cell cycle sensor histidine kinase and response regulator CckA
MAAVFLLVAHPGNAGAVDPLKVLVLNSYHQGYGWTDQQLAGIRETLAKSERPVTIHVEDLDRKRESDRGYLDIFRQYLAAKYRGKGIDLVIATDNDAFDFFKDHRASVLGTTPLVFSGVNFFRDDMLAGLAAATGIAETFEGDKSIALMRRLHPQAGRIVVIVDGTTTGVKLQKELGEIIAARVRIRVLGQSLTRRDNRPPGEVAARRSRTVDAFCP